LYDEDKDSWSRITLLDTLRHWGRWNQYGKLCSDHVVMAGLGEDDGLFHYKVHGLARGSNDVYLRVARCFGLMEDKWLGPTALHAVATSACKSLTDKQMDAIRRGVALYDKILTLPHGGAAFADAVLNGKASYAGLYFISRMPAPVHDVTADNIADADAFIDAWGEFYHMMVARFGGLYNPCLDPRKVPKWLPANNAGVPKLHDGPMVLFETTLAHDTGVYVTGGVVRSTLLERRDPNLIGDFKEHGAVPFNVGTIINDFSARFTMQEKGATDPLNVERNMQAIGTYYDYLSAEPQLQELYAYFLYAAVHGEVEWDDATVTPAAVAGVMGAAKMAKVTARNKVTLKLRDPPTVAEGTQRFPKFLDVIGWLSSFIQAAMRSEFNMEDQEYLLRLYLGQMRPTNTTAAVVRFFVVDTRRGDGIMLTPADVGTERYLTPESNFISTDSWTQRLQGNTAERFFRGVSDAYAHFYDDKGDIVDFLVEKPPEDGGKRSRTTQYDPGMNDEMQDEPHDHHHFTHDSWPFAQKPWQTKYADAMRQENLPWERSARIVFLAAPTSFQVCPTI
jgi:hypothetical protein